MKVFVPLLCMVSLILAEPPVGDGYPAARSDNHDHDHGDFGEHHPEDQRSLSQEYGPPSSRNSLASDYDAPNSRSQNPRGRSQFPPPSVHVSFNQRFSSAASRNAAASKSSSRGSGQGYPGARSQTQEYSGSNARNGISQEYGPPRSSSQEYNSPAARSPSTEYGVPNSSSSPSEEYGVPVVAARSNQFPRSSFNSQAFASHDQSAPASRSFQADSHSHSAPSSRSNTESHFETSKPAARSSASQSRSNDGQGYDAPRTFGRSAGFDTPSSSYGTPSSRSLSASYSAPSARNTNSQNHDGHGNSVSETYGAPSHDASQYFAGPSTRGLSQDYGVPSSRSNLKTEAIASSYTPASARSAPSSTYLPASRSAMPSQEYGVPDQDRQGYEDAQARALNELLNQEPANYDFAYQIEDQESGSDFGHTETREENRAQGSYFVVLPDGTKQTVEYEADERGFKPRISVEPAAAGYDDNAQDLARTAGGPY